MRLKSAILLFCLMVGSAFADPTIALDGDNIVLAEHANGTAPITYQWYKNDRIIVNAVGHTLTISRFDVGTYYMKATNSKGSATGQKIEIVVTSAASAADWTVTSKKK